MSQDELDQCWQRLAEKMEEEILDKYKVDDSERVAYRGGGFPLEWTRVWKSRQYRIRKKGEKTAGQEFSLCSWKKRRKMLG